MIWGSILGRTWEFFSSPPRPKQLWSPPRLSIQWVPGAPSLGIKRPEREADHSHASSAEVKEYVELYLHPPIGLHDVVLSSSTGTNLPFNNNLLTVQHSSSYNSGTTEACL
jgi:hypothetical protein